MNKKRKMTGEIITERLTKIYFRQDLYQLIKKIIFIIIILFVLTEYVCVFQKNTGNSMDPSIKDGDLTLVYEFDKAYGIGDVISFRKDDKKYISRIIAIQGDTIDINDEGQVLINGEIIEEEGIFYETYKSRNTILPITLKENEYFVLGDMRASAKDSRDFGTVTSSEIIGKIIYIFRNKNV